MTPAEHYAEAERLLHLATGDFPAVPIASDIAALAQVHATLATVEPEMLRRAGLGPVAQHPACICPRHDHEPLARLATFPACPIHGDKG